MGFHTSSVFKALGSLHSPGIQETSLVNLILVQVLAGFSRISTVLESSICIQFVFQSLSLLGLHILDTLEKGSTLLECQRRKGGREGKLMSVIGHRWHSSFLCA